VGTTAPSKPPALPYGRATEQAEGQVSSPRVSKGCASTQWLTELWRCPGGPSRL